MKTKQPKETTKGTKRLDPPQYEKRNYFGLGSGERAMIGCVGDWYC